MYDGKCLQHPTLSYTQEELENIYAKNDKALETKAIGHPVQCWNWKQCSKQTKWGKEGKPSGKKSPLKLNTESSLNHPNELTPDSERR